MTVHFSLVGERNDDRQKGKKEKEKEKKKKGGKNMIMEKKENED